MKMALLSAIVMLIGIISAVARDWQPIARECANEVMERYDCGADGYVCWPKIFDCTVSQATPGAEPQKVQSCEQMVTDKHPRSSDDPVKQAMLCVMR